MHGRTLSRRSILHLLQYRFECYGYVLSFVDELVTAATSPFCFVASVFDIAAFSKPKTIASIESVSCLDFIMSVSVLITAAVTSQALTFRFSWRGFFFFSGSLSHHSESSLFCVVDNSLYSEFVWYHRCTPVLPMLAFPSFVVALDTSVALAFAPLVPQVSEMFAADRFVPADHFLATGS